jgi:RNA methyltransferase, TrmH family
MITSFQNPKMKWVRSLLDSRQEREQAQAFVIEGVRLVEEAMNARWLPMTAFFSPKVSERGRSLVEQLIGQGCEIEEIADSLMEKITGTDTPQGILAVLPIRKPETPLNINLALIADEIRDPGNLGTLLRTCSAAGVQQVFLTPGSTDPFSPKVLRAGMGAHFRIPIQTLAWDNIYAQCKELNRPPLRLFLAEANRGKSCWEIDLRQPLALIIGGEAFGAGQLARRSVDDLVYIPMPGNTESLNAAIAAGILLFEVIRQRML